MVRDGFLRGMRNAPCGGKRKEKVK